MEYIDYVDVSVDIVNTLQITVHITFQKKIEIYFSFKKRKVAKEKE